MTLPTITDARWQAILARDRAQDGLFYYAVSTTGIFCNPSCSARHPKIEHVTFFDTLTDAQRAGYRPCLRCTPGLPTPAERDAAQVAALCRYIDDHAHVPSLEELAAHVDRSPSHVHRLFKSIVGLTPRAYAQAKRGARVRKLLPQAPNITAALHRAGYASASRFYAAAPSILGMTPSTYRAHGVGRTIRFAVGECWLGAVLVAATDKGVCAILLGDDPEALVHELEERFSRATLIGADDAFETHVAQVIALIEHPTERPNLPFDIQGTAFQYQVWSAISAIPAGSTATYSDLARVMGRPNASRAVAQACGANPVAVAIPCHRVVRKDGSLAGYRWGVARKKALLKREQQVVDTEDTDPP